MGDPSVELNSPQFRFLRLPQKFRAYVGGFGSGKTWVGCNAMLAGFLGMPRVNQGFFAPTYPQIRDIFYPTIEEVAAVMDMRVSIKRGDKEVDVYRGRKYYGTVLCRSMDKPESIVGFKIGHALVDELDTLAHIKAQHAWRKIIARLRFQNARNGADVTTTPEGFRFVYQQFVKAVRDNPKLGNRYGLVQASTYENAANLDPDYIPSLLESYPPELIEAYLKGQFVNLTAGTVYHCYNRRLNGTDEVAAAGEPVFVGMDFNVGKMAAVIHVKRKGLPRAVDEITGAYDTPDIIRRIKERFWQYADGDYRKSREIFVYPDASGNSRKSVNASTSDLQLLKNAGFRVKANPANPPVKDRVTSMNAMFLNANGERRYLVNAEKCPVYAETLEQQAWLNGEPDKTNDTDHPNDAAGYFIVTDYPVLKRSIVTQTLRGT